MQQARAATTEPRAAGRAAASGNYVLGAVAVKYTDSDIFWRHFREILLQWIKTYNRDFNRRFQWADKQIILPVVLPSDRNVFTTNYFNFLKWMWALPHKITEKVHVADIKKMILNFLKRLADIRYSMMFIKRLPEVRNQDTEYRACMLVQIDAAISQLFSDQITLIQVYDEHENEINEHVSSAAGEQKDPYAALPAAEPNRVPQGRVQVANLPQNSVQRTFSPLQMIMQFSNWDIAVSPAPSPW
jgi:hypothetical protein